MQKNDKLTFQSDFCSPEVGVKFVKIGLFPSICSLGFPDFLLEGKGSLILKVSLCCHLMHFSSIFHFYTHCKYQKTLGVQQWNIELKWINVKRGQRLLEFIQRQLLYLILKLCALPSKLFFVESQQQSTVILEKGVKYIQR